MNEKKIVEMATKTLEIISKLFDDVEIPRVSNEQEIAILGQMAPVILSELIREERNNE